jgi:hypothetical protein
MLMLQIEPLTFSPAFRHYYLMIGKRGPWANLWKLTNQNAQSVFIAALSCK